jgi:superfamily II DNA or RNA helicase
MDIIYEVQEAINDGLTSTQIKKYILKNIKSLNFCNALIEDPILIKNIFNNHIIKIIQSNKDINNIKKILNNNPDKLKLIRYINCINEYLEEINFIENYINNNQQLIDNKQFNNEQLLFNNEQLVNNDKQLFNNNEIDNLIKLQNNNEIDNLIELQNNDEKLFNNEIDNLIELQNNELDIPIFKLRPNQLKALEKNKELKFISGVHIQVTGAGKSLIILRTIMDKLEYDINIQNKKYIYFLLTDKIEILYNWFFKNGKFNQENIDYWKNNNIIDLTKFEILNTIVNKDNNIINKINNAIKPTLIIMNNAQFKLKYDKIKNNNISLCIIDESHSVSGPEFYKALKYLKYNLNTSIIGFSATTIRKTKKSIHQICDIFGTLGKLNILSLYDNIHALQDDVILPYKFIITSIKNNIDHKIILKEILNKEFENLPYKKIIAWCRKINYINQYVDFFKNNFLELDVFYTHSKEINDNIEKFYKKDNNSILLCVGRCREGCDIKNIDCGIYLDRVKNRSILVSQQCNGRIIRPDKEGFKKYGLIIENIYDENESIEYLTVQQLMSYYESIISLAENAEEYNIIEIIEEFKTVYKNTIFSPEKKEIIIKVDNNNNHDIIIKIEIKDLNWSLMKQFLNEKINYKDKLKTEFELLKSEIQKLKLNHKNDYLKLDNYEKNSNIKYHNYGWINWYDFLGIDTSIYPLFKNNWIDKCIKYNVTNINDYNLNYHKYNLPSMPEELYKEFKSFYEEFDNVIRK